MFEKFEKYWSEFSLILAIVVILDSHYKLQFVDWSYKKFYENDSYEFQRVKDNLFSLMMNILMLPKLSRLLVVVSHRLLVILTIKLMMRDPISWL